MDPRHRTNDSPTTNPGSDEGATKDGGISGLKKLDEPCFAYEDHADVYKGILDGKPVAIKQLRGVNSTKTDARDNLRVVLRRQFSKSWRHFNHPNVCRVYMVVEDYGFLPALVLDYYPRGSPIKYIEKNDPPFLRYFSSTKSTLKYDKLDVFAFGMMILEIFSGQPPYADKPDTGAIFAIAKSEPPTLPKSMSDDPELKKLFDDCTRKIPDDRPPVTLRSVYEQPQSPMSTTSNVPDLPPEIWRHICRYILPSDRTNVALVSRSLYGIIVSDLYHHIEIVSRSFSLFVL
ncbi:Serine/threonine-protein kinase STE20 [Leucoagaricus sp. SymC.cos]|nr:Serine/threonine-protein kinase STE20 [Leucoagaricus sp. SymC.cos]